MLVVDTSALILALADPSQEAADQLRKGEDLHAPHLIDIEFIHVLRKLTRRGEINDNQANQLLTSLNDLPMARYPHHPLSQQIWKHRHNLTTYDASFVVLAETLEAPLITADKKMAAAPGCKDIEFLVVTA